MDSLILLFMYSITRLKAYMCSSLKLLIISILISKFAIKRKLIVRNNHGEHSITYYGSSLQNNKAQHADNQISGQKAKVTHKVFFHDVTGKIYHFYDHLLMPKMACSCWKLTRERNKKTGTFVSSNSDPKDSKGKTICMKWTKIRPISNP